MKKVSYFIPAVLWTLVILALCLMPSSDIPNTFASRIPYFDKLVHCGIFAGFVVLWALGMKQAGKKHPMVYLARVILIAIFLGLIIEILQKELVTLHRSFDWWDWIADCVGAFLGGAIFREIYRGKEEKTT